MSQSLEKLKDSFFFIFRRNWSIKTLNKIVIWQTIIGLVMILTNIHILSILTPTKSILHKFVIYVYVYIYICVCVEEKHLFNISVYLNTYYSHKVSNNNTTIPCKKLLQTESPWTLKFTHILEHVRTSIHLPCQ